MGENSTKVFSVLSLSYFHQFMDVFSLERFRMYGRAYILACFMDMYSKIYRPDSHTAGRALECKPYSYYTIIIAG